MSGTKAPACPSPAVVRASDSRDNHFHRPAGAAIKHPYQRHGTRQLSPTHFHTDANPKLSRAELQLICTSLMGRKVRPKEQEGRSLLPQHSGSTLPYGTRVGTNTPGANQGKITILSARNYHWHFPHGRWQERGLTLGFGTDSTFGRALTVNKPQKNHHCIYSPMLCPDLTAQQTQNTDQKKTPPCLNTVPVLPPHLPRAAADRFYMGKLRHSTAPDLPRYTEQLRQNKNPNIFPKSQKRLNYYSFLGLRVQHTLVSLLYCKAKGSTREAGKGGCCNKTFLKHVLGWKEGESNPVSKQPVSHAPPELQGQSGQRSICSHSSGQQLRDLFRI